MQGWSPLLANEAWYPEPTVAGSDDPDPLPFPNTAPNWSILIFAHIAGPSGEGPTLVSSTSPSREAEHGQQTAQDLLPRYSVILHNDDHHAMDFVVTSLLKSVSSLSNAEAISIMLEAHSHAGTGSSYPDRH